jgi:hypothetical protein
MFPIEANDWAQQTFGSCKLGDARRTKRLVDVGARMAGQIGSSLSKCCEGDEAALTGSYRLLRNEEVTPDAIREGGFATTASHAQAHELLLAVEDTTTVSYAHAAAMQLGITSNSRHAKRRGYQVHSVLLLNAQSEQTVGLIEQTHWQREASGYGKKRRRNRRAYEDKESYKWQQASVLVAQRLGEVMTRTIAVCDREADLYDYLDYKLQHGQRFVVRAKADRQVLGNPAGLFATLEEDGVEWCCYTVAVPQRGGRPARTARLSLRSAALTILPPVGRAARREPLGLNAVLVDEIDAPREAEPLRWVLLTTEAVAGAEEALTVVDYYQSRWRVEDYHKAWKSGVGVERQRFQSPDNLERMLAITAFLAVRLLQLRQSQEMPTTRDSATCNEVLRDDEWQILWVSTERSAPPSSPPGVRWAYLALARLGGFTDTKHTGRPGWSTLWHGWFRLQERVAGWQISQMALADL